MLTLVNKNCDKKELRKYALKKRALLSMQKSPLILSKILNSKEFIEAKNVALYLPIKGEIDISPLLKIKNKNFFLPRTVGADLEFAKFEGYDSLELGKFGILEPKSEKIDPSIFDIIYLPALMANKNCYRLGYGKGYYDRFFARNKISALKLIIVAVELISDEFTEDENDYRADGIISA